MLKKLQKTSGSVMIGTCTKLVLPLHPSAKTFVPAKQHWKRRMIFLLLLLQKKIVTEQVTKVKTVADGLRIHVIGV